ncbi:hypothetical protein D918_01214 [Trichuris suis]|nr:hypothetical protein D918_01214 [Trichuris suis]
MKGITVLLAITIWVTLLSEQHYITAAGRKSKEVGALRKPASTPIRAFCGDVSLMKSKTKGSTHHSSSFPWDALIATKKMGSVRCIGSLLYQYPITHYANISDLIVTAGKCFRRHRKGHWLDVSGRVVYVAPAKHSFRTKTGIKRDIESGFNYPIPNATAHIRDGIALLKLKQPVPLGEHVQAVCLPEPKSLPPPKARCFYSRFYKNEDRMRKEKVPLADPVRCYEMEEKTYTGFPGICTQEKKKRGAVQLGSPLVCRYRGRYVQYGVYLTPAVKNTAVFGNITSMGFYRDMSIVQQVLSEKSGQHMSWQPPEGPKAQSNGQHMQHSQQKQRSKSSASSIFSESQEGFLPVQ